VHPLNRKVVHGDCGETFMNAGRDYLACHVADAKGSCDNRARVCRDRLEAMALEGPQDVSCESKISRETKSARWLNAGFKSRGAQGFHEQSNRPESLAPLASGRWGVNKSIQLAYARAFCWCLATSAARRAPHLATH
jgi:hypothetical protein